MANKESRFGSSSRQQSSNPQKMATENFLLEGQPWKTAWNRKPKWVDRVWPKKIKPQKSQESWASNKPVVASLPNNIQPYSPIFPPSQKMMTLPQVIDDHEAGAANLQDGRKCVEGEGEGEIDGHNPEPEPGSEIRGDSAAEVVRRPPSPRTQLQTFIPTNRDAVQKSFLSGPLERYLRGERDSAGSEDYLARSPEAWDRLRASRAKVLRLRAQLRAERKQIYEQHQKRLQADQAFMKHVRENHVLHQLPSTSACSRAQFDVVFETYYSSLQAARDECGPLEFEFEILENQLDEAEFELAKLEGHLYDTGTVEDSRPDSVIQPSPQDSLVGVGSKYHPLHYKYLSRLGDLDLAEERHQALLQERDRILSVLETRASVGVELPADDREFLDHFENSECGIGLDISNIREEIDELRKQCSEEGINLDGESESESQASHEEVQAEDSTDMILGNGDTDVASMFPLLLPRLQEEKLKLRVLITDFAEGNKSDRVNRWLLHQLQNSSYEVELLLRIYLQVSDDLEIDYWETDIMQWQIHVIFWWMRDEANKSFNNSFTNSHASETVRAILTTKAQ